KTFYPAEAEHQDYYQRNPENYQRNAERRNKFIHEVW
ncbi:peptide-methionine (S)-S-oxide reductase, partial [Enterococcus faecium]|nr:peptide-methionine (S)-S-oxide reductase [Enterococcus faecium]